VAVRGWIYYFNPSKVWFKPPHFFQLLRLLKKFQSLKGLIQTIKIEYHHRYDEDAFQSLKGLIQTRPQLQNLNLQNLFQSLKGLIQTDYPSYSIWPSIPYFNPSKVWFKLCRRLRGIHQTGRISIPQRSDSN